jgi:uncharacterized protein YndB with AHSA1/START domain
MAGSVDHRTFVIERVLEADVRRVYAAWSNEEAKRRWMACDDRMVRSEYRLDFRVGGAETNRLIDLDGIVHHFEGYYLDIVDNERLIYAYTMSLGDTKLSASIVTVQFAPQGPKTLMTFTEQIAFLDGHQDPEARIRGTEEGLEMLDKELSRVHAAGA